MPSDIQQQVLALPGTDDLQEHLVLGLLDQREGLNEGRSEQFHQRFARPKFAQRLIQAARQPKREVMGTAGDRIGCYSEVSTPFGAAASS